MEEEFYAVIKLVSGEEIVSLVSKDDNDGDPVLILQSPIIMHMINSHRGHVVKIKPWMEVPDDDFYVIKPENIMTMTELKNEMVIDMYNSYLNDEEVSFSPRKPNRNFGKVKPSRQMGYVSSVENARNILENLYKLKDNKES